MVRQVIVVEGRTDTQKLKKIFGEELQTIETKGLAISSEILELIKKVNQSNQIIIFTDPDGPGKIIREKIIKYLDGDVLNAFITKQAINSNSKKIGIAEANEEEIRKALKSLLVYNAKNISITWNEYVNNDFYLKAARVKIAKYYNLSDKISSKTLFKWINWMNLDIESLKEIVGE